MITQLKRLGSWMSAHGEESHLPTRMFWVALLVRVAYITLAHTYRIRLYIDHFDFGWEMGRIARALATRRGFADPFDGHTGPTAWTPPLYPLLLGGVFKIFGIYTRSSAWVILTLNSVFSAATAPAVYEIARRCFARHPKCLGIALWSGWLWALYPAAMQYAVHWVWDMALTACLFAWVIVVALRLRGIGKAKGVPHSSRLHRDEWDVNFQPWSQPSPLWAAFGLLWGLIALSNSSLLTFLPVSGLWIVWPELAQPSHWSHAARNVLIGSLCCVAVVAPWMIRNQRVFHTFVPLRANLGAELFLSMQADLQGFPWGPTIPINRFNPELQRYKRMGELPYVQRQGERAKILIHRYPGRLARFTLKRAYFFWVSVPHPVEKSFFLEIVREINFGFASIGAILGLALALQQRIPGAWLFFWAFAIVPIPYYLITVQARFRHPLEPIMLILIVFLFQSAEPRTQPA